MELHLKWPELLNDSEPGGIIVFTCYIQCLTEIISTLAFKQKRTKPALILAWLHYKMCVFYESGVEESELGYSILDL